VRGRPPGSHWFRPEQFLPPPSPLIFRLGKVDRITHLDGSPYNPLHQRWPVEVVPAGDKKSLAFALTNFISYLPDVSCQSA